jgi:hypothetical protein
MPANCGLFTTSKISSVVDRRTFGRDIPESLYATKREFPFSGDSVRRPKNKTTAVWVGSVWNVQVAR